MFDVTEDYFPSTKKFLNKKIMSCHLTNLGTTYSVVQVRSSKDSVVIRLINPHRTHWMSELSVKSWKY